MGIRIKVEGATFLVRGPWSAAQLKEQYASYVAKFKSRLSFKQWLVTRGKVYLRVPKSRK